jgi:hypothetical protein
MKMASFAYNRQNDATYQDILKGYQQQQAVFNTHSQAIDQNYQGMIADNKNVGESDRVALRQQYDRNLANTQQSMASRGLGNTTLLDSARRGVNYDYENSNIALNDSLYRRQTDLQNQRLGYAAQAQQGLANLQGAQLGYQGDALSQRYNAEANFVSQYDLAAQGAKLGYANQSSLQSQQQNYALQTMQKQFQNQDYMQSKYGYYS